MRVAFDAGPLLDPPTGVGRYVRELGQSLETVGVDVVRYAVALGGKPPPAVKRLRMPARVAQTLWVKTGRPSLARLVGRVDLFHGTNFVLPPLGEARGVVTIHDLSFFGEDAFPGAGRLRSLVPWSVERAARVIVPTQAIKDEVLARLPVSGDRVDVVHEGVGPIFFRPPPAADTMLGELGILGRFALAVGTMAPRKNLQRLIEAWVRAAPPDWTLVLAGPKGWGPDLPETPGVLPIGWVPDEGLPGLMAAADLFCYPSIYEGFGLPPLEAMAAGTPVLVGRYAAAEEVIGDAGVLVDPLDVDAMAEALALLTSDEGARRRLAMAGRAHAAGFSWERAAAG
ncbi:MAG: glycosyltransferase family 4 protein, partial [Actinobacteria bacterium]|nr:glycosyltransferase family 4 protein [Actinomycetota bacterium]